MSLSRDEAAQIDAYHASPEGRAAARDLKVAAIQALLAERDLVAEAARRVEEAGGRPEKLWDARYDLDLQIDALKEEAGGF